MSIELKLIEKEPEFQKHHIYVLYSKEQDEVQYQMWNDSLREKKCVEIFSRIGKVCFVL